MVSTVVCVYVGSEPTGNFSVGSGGQCVVCMWDDLLVMAKE